jgi:hypothetical protein
MAEFKQSLYRIIREKDNDYETVKGFLSEFGDQPPKNIDSAIKESQKRAFDEYSDNSELTRARTGLTSLESAVDEVIRQNTGVRGSFHYGEDQPTENLKELLIGKIGSFWKNEIPIENGLIGVITGSILGFGMGATIDYIGCDPPIMKFLSTIGGAVILGYYGAVNSMDKMGELHEMKANAKYLDDKIEELY